MSKILDDLKGAGDKSGRCHVRVSDNMTYGPVALQTVCQWAQQGRITAESEISFDHKQWVRADRIPELALDWIAVDEGETYGPFNLQALGQLVRRGLVAPDAKVTHSENGETLAVPDALERASEMRPLNAASARLMQSVPRPAPSPTAASNTMEPEAYWSEVAKPEIVSADTGAAGGAQRVDIDALVDAANRERRRADELEAERDRLREENTAFAAKLESAVAQQSEGAIALEKNAKVMADLEAKLAEARTTLTERQEEIDLLNQTRHAEQAKAADEIEGLKDALKAATKHLDEREGEHAEQIARLKDELVQTREAAAQHESEGGLEVDELRSALNQMSDRLKAAEARVKDEQVESGTLRSELDVAKQEVAMQEQQLVQIKDELKQRDQRIAELEQELAASAAAVRNVDVDTAGPEEVAKLIREKQRLEERVARFDQALAAKDEAIAVREAALASRDAALAEKDEVIAHRDEALAERKAKVAQIEEALQKAAERVDAESTDMEALKADLKSQKERTGEVARELATLRDTLEAEQTRAKALAAELELLRAEREQHEASKTEPQPATQEAQPEQWFLRYDGEHVLGPVSLHDLMGWAKDCRVAPDHEVSTDKAAWTKAGDMAALEMDWMVTLVDGTEYGPINKYAVSDLLADAAVSKETELTHRKSGEKIRVDQVITA